MAVHVPTGTKYATTTRNDGRYNLPNLKIGGPYIITTAFVGLKSEKINDVFLNLGQTFKQNFELTEDVTQVEEVLLRHNDKTFSSSRTGSQELIYENSSDRLPTINRSIQDL